MNDIIKAIMEEVKKEIIIYKNKSEDNFDFWENHVKYVYKEAIKLAEIYNADINIVKIGALLHDIALIKEYGDRKSHHSNGAILAKEILDKYELNDSIKEKLIGCVYNHRSSKNAANIEERCIADADILAHFDNIPMLFNSAFNRYNMDLNSIKMWMKKTFEDDYNDLSDETKKLFKDRYKNILNIVLGDEFG
jgi:uncharacterized domain HDIG